MTTEHEEYVVGWLKERGRSEVDYAPGQSGTDNLSELLDQLHGIDETHRDHSLSRFSSSRFDRPALVALGTFVAVIALGALTWWWTIAPLSSDPAPTDPTATTMEEEPPVVAPPPAGGFGFHPNAVSRDGRTSVEVTFTDGRRVVVEFPSEWRLEDHSWNPYTHLVLEQEDSATARWSLRYAALSFSYSDQAGWVPQVLFRPEWTDDEKALVSDLLDWSTEANGFITVRTTRPLSHFTDDPDQGPIRGDVDQGADMHIGVLVTLTSGCHPNTPVTATSSYVYWCDVDSNVAVHFTTDPRHFDFVVANLDISARGDDDPPLSWPEFEPNQPNRIEPFIPDVTRVGERLELLATFPDGTRAVFEWPNDLDILSGGVRPFAGGWYGQSAADFDILHAPLAVALTLDAPPQLLKEYDDGEGGTIGLWRPTHRPWDSLGFQFGPWAVLVPDPGSDLLRAAWARNLKGTVNDRGFLVLHGENDLQIYGAGEQQDLLRLEFRGQGEIGVIPQRCQPGEFSSPIDDDAFAHWCHASGLVSLRVWGTPEFQVRVLAELGISFPR